MIWLILLLSFGLRLITINQSLWLDEAINVVSAQRLDFFSFITRYPIGDFHPPAYFALLWLWGHLFGFSEIAVRLPSVILGVLTVGLTYFLGKELGNKKAALVGASLLAVAPLHVYYSQEARMYSLAAFAATLSFYFLVKCVKGGLWALCGYTVSVILILYSDYVAYLVLPAQLIFLLWYDRKSIKKILGSWGISLLFFLPWMLVFPEQLLTGRAAAVNLSGWNEVVGGTSLKNLALVWVKTLVGRISFDNKGVYAGVIGCLSILWILGIEKGIGGIRGVRRIRENEGLLLSWILVPLILAWGISFIIPILSYFRLIFILPAFYLLLSYGLSKFPKVWSTLLISIILLGELLSLFIYYTSPQFHREDWKGAVSFIRADVRFNDLVIFENNHVPYPFVYYADQLIQAEKGLIKIPAQTLEDTTSGDHLLGKERIYVFEYLVDITDPQRLLDQKIISLGFKKTKIYNFSGVGFINQYESN